MRSFLKWAGGKYELLRHLKKFLMPGHRLIEPFAGAATVFLNTEYARYIIADTNPDLINTFNVLKKEGKKFITFAQSFFSNENNSAAQYYTFRKQFNESCDLRLKAALFIYLNRHGFNGLCRYNDAGSFNVPFGQHKKPYFPEERMHFFHEKAQTASFKLNDFADTMLTAQPGDIIYCDPPYIPLSNTANFTRYAKNNFQYPQQEKLARLASDCAKRGIPVIISNYDTMLTRRLYHQAKKISILVRRHISANGNRNKVKEIIAIFDKS